MRKRERKRRVRAIVYRVVGGGLLRYRSGGVVRMCSRKRLERALIALDESLSREREKLREERERAPALMFKREVMQRALADEQRERFAAGVPSLPIKILDLYEVPPAPFPDPDFEEAQPS